MWTGTDGVRVITQYGVSTAQIIADAVALGYVAPTWWQFWKSKATLIKD